MYERNVLNDWVPSSLRRTEKERIVLKDGVVWIPLIADSWGVFLVNLYTHRSSSNNLAVFRMREYVLVFLPTALLFTDYHGSIPKVLRNRKLVVWICFET